MSKYAIAALSPCVAFGTRTTSAGDDAMTTDSGASDCSALDFSSRRFHTTSSQLALSRQRAMPSPMMPMPMNPTGEDAAMRGGGTRRASVETRSKEAAISRGVT